MPRIKVARRQQRALAPVFPAPLFPARSVSSLTRMADELTARTNEMIRTAFADLLNFPASEWFPAVNVSETKDEFMLTAELPGMTARDVTVDYTDGVLTIRGEKEQEETREEDGRRYHMWERRFGSFQRSIPFPSEIAEDRITAEFKDGVLTVHLPKAEEEKTKAHTIPVTERK